VQEGIFLEYNISIAGTDRFGTSYNIKKS